MQIIDLEKANTIVGGATYEIRCNKPGVGENSIRVDAKSMSDKEADKRCGSGKYAIWWEKV